METKDSHKASSMKRFAKIGDPFQVLKMLTDSQLIFYAPGLIRKN